MPSTIRGQDLARAVLDTIDALVIVLAPDGAITHFNRACENATGYAASDVQGRRVWDFLVAPTDVEQERAAFDDLRHGALQTQREATWISKDGSARRIAWSNSLVSGAVGTPRSVVDTGIDITERSRAEEERSRLLVRERAALEAAEKGNRARDLLLAMVSHELRTPVTSILAWAQLLRRDPQNASRRDHALSVIENSARSLTGIIDDLLDTARLVQGRLTVNVEEVDPASALAAAVDAIRPAADEKDIRIETAVAPDAGILLADPGRLQQVLWNLLANAIKFSPRRSRVSIAVDSALCEDRRYCGITVRDQGEGLRPELLGRIFEPFTQADSSSTRAYGGLGLGLSIVRGLVEAQGGSVRAESAGAGAGTTLRVELPCLARDESSLVRQARLPGARTSPGPGSEHPDLRGLRLLLVEDVDDAREAMGLLLTAFGAQVIEASSASQAFDLMVKHHPDVLVSDIAMPVEDGYSLMRRIRSSAPAPLRQIPSLALTAYAREEDSLCARLAGFQAHAAKPMEPIALARLIANLAGRSVPPPRYASSSVSAPRSDSGVPSAATASVMPK